MKRLVLFLAVVFLAACGGQPTAAPVAATETPVTEPLHVITLAPPTAAPEPIPALSPAEVPESEVIPQWFETAEGMRGVLTVSGWIAGDEGRIFGAEGTLKQPISLGSLPKEIGVVIDCHLYVNNDGEVVVEKNYLCVGEEKILSYAEQTLLPEGSKVIILFGLPIEGSASETWPEGIANK